MCLDYDEQMDFSHLPLWRLWFWLRLEEGSGDKEGVSMAEEETERGSPSVGSDKTLSNALDSKDNDDHDCVGFIQRYESYPFREGVRMVVGSSSVVVSSPRSVLCPRDLYYHRTDHQHRTPDRYRVVF